MNKKVVAVISGGPDSIGYAAQWFKRGYRVYPIIFYYSQKGAKEVSVAKELCVKLGFEDPLVLDISFMKFIWKKTQLVDESIDVEKEYMSSVVVPIRNAVFLTIAAAYAFSIGAQYVIYGAHLDDNSPLDKHEVLSTKDLWQPRYPDCSPEFQLVLETALNIGHFRSSRSIQIWSPAREGLTKVENLRRSYEIMGDLIFETWSCYLSFEHHCGRCESCLNRKKAFREAGILDKTKYMV